MRLEKIISMASEKVRLRFLAMERSLREVGCDLPLWVIPFDDSRFELPTNAIWWEMPEITDWLHGAGAHPVMRKYQCLTEANYQFVDSDVILLRNPAIVLEDQSGFVTSCCHWRCVGDTVTRDSYEIMKARTTTWHRSVFNTGQYACDRALYSVADLKTTAARSDLAYTCLHIPYHEQPGLNLFVFESGIEVNNLTLPPVRMESTWAGDYPADFRHFWCDEKTSPYLIHWAGTDMAVPRPINELFYRYLSPAERAEWDEAVRIRTRAVKRARNLPRAVGRRLKRAAHAFLEP